MVVIKGLMEGTNALKPMFITGGFNSGIMKFVGEARAKYNPTVVKLLRTFTLGQS
jgi:hypothetical protein